MYKKRAFTLIEVLIVVAILGLLSAIAIPNFIKTREGTAENACQANRTMFEAGIEQWALDENKTKAEMQTKFGTSAAKKTIKNLSGDNIEYYFDPADAVCPSDDTKAYTSYVDTYGRAVVECPVSGH